MQVGMATFISDEGGRVKCAQCPHMAQFHGFNFERKVEEFVCPNGHISETPEIKEPPKKKI